jgi:hypothetical protein
LPADGVPGFSGEREGVRRRFFSIEGVPGEAAAASVLPTTLTSGGQKKYIKVAKFNHCVERSENILFPTNLRQFAYWFFMKCIANIFF